MTLSNTQKEEVLARFEKGYKNALIANPYSDKEEFDEWEDGNALEWSKKFILSELSRILEEKKVAVARLDYGDITQTTPDGHLKAYEKNGYNSCKSAVLQILSNEEK